MSDNFTAHEDIEPDAPSDAGESYEAPDEGTPTEDVDAADGSVDTPVDEGPFHTIKVDGQDVQVSQAELVGGYLRQSDYTRKTQQLAEQRKGLTDAEALVAALNRNPEQTLAVLAQAYGLRQENGDGDDDLLTDDERRLRDIEAWRDHQVAQSREAQIDNEIARLHRDYGDFPEDQLFAYAVASNTMNLETALRAMQYEQVVAQARARGEDKRMAKRAAGSAANGSSRAGAVAPNEDAEIKTVADAFAYAKRSLNAS